MTISKLIGAVMLALMAGYLFGSTFPRTRYQSNAKGIVLDTWTGRMETFWQQSEARKKKEDAQILKGVFDAPDEPLNSKFVPANKKEDEKPLPGMHFVPDNNRTSP